MILDSVILESICADFVSTHTRSYLTLSVVCYVTIIRSFELAVNPLLYFCHSRIQTVLSAATFCFGCNTCRKVCDATTVLVLVAILSSSTGTTIPFDLEISFGNSWCCPDILAVYDSDGNGAGMNSALAFRRRNTLYSMTTGLIV